MNYKRRHKKECNQVPKKKHKNKYKDHSDECSLNLQRKVCLSKKYFKSQLASRSYAMKMRNQVSYKCRFCDGYHLQGVVKLTKSNRKSQ